MSDKAVARYLRDGSETQRRQRLALTVEGALADGLMADVAATCRPEELVTEVLHRDDPITLVVDAKTGRLAGVLAPFDLL